MYVCFLEGRYIGGGYLFCLPPPSDNAKEAQQKREGRFQLFFACVSGGSDE